MTDQHNAETTSGAIAQGEKAAAASNRSVAVSGDVHGNITIGSDPPPPPYQIPQEVPHFTDRDAELKQLVAALTPGATYTLCGPGGMGKTSLAAKALHELYAQGDLARRFPGGVIFHSIGKYKNRG